MVPPSLVKLNYRKKSRAKYQRFWKYRVMNIETKQISFSVGVQRQSIGMVLSAQWCFELNSSYMFLSPLEHLHCDPL